MNAVTRTGARVLLLGTLVSLTGLACGGEEPGGSVGSTSAPLLEGRTIPIERGTERVQARVDESDPDFLELSQYVGGRCAAIATGARYVDGYVAGHANDGALNTDLRDQALALCEGYTWLELTNGVAPVDVTLNVDNDIVFEPRRPGSAASIVLMTIPVLVGSDAATAALLATRSFQDAALQGRALMRNTQIATAAWTGTLPSTGTDVVSVGFVLISQTNEATQMMRESAQEASRAIAAAAQERLALDPDPLRARILSWRAIHDSRLEIANLWLGVPAELFEPESTGPAALTSAEGLFPVVAWAPERDSERRAVELLRATHTDPRPNPTVERRASS